MDLNTLRSFVAVAQLGSFTRAADQLVLQKSKVSRQIAALEAAMGVRLLERSTQRLRLTHAGAAFFDRCRDALSEIDLAQAQARSVSATPQGELRLAAPYELGSWLCEAVLPEFLARYPALRLQLRLSYRYQDLLDEGLDAALRTGHRADAAYVGQRIGHFERALFASPAYLARAGTPRQPGELARHACLVFSHANAGANWRLTNGSREHEVKVQGPLQADHFGALRNAAVAGLGITALPARFFATDAASQRLQRVLPRWRLGEGEIHLVYPSRRFKPAKLSALIDFLRTHPLLSGAPAS